MSWRSIGLYVWILSQAVAYGQTTFQLSDSNYHPLTKPTDIVFPVKCDDHGNVYFRFSAHGPGKFDVVKIAPDGAQKAVYSYWGDAKLRDDTLLADSVGEHGEMYELLGGAGHRVLLVRFSAEGNLEATDEFEAPEPFTPSQLETLPGGTFFVSGVLVGDKTGRRAGQPVNAFYDNNGHRLREIHLKQDAGRLKQSLAGPDRNGSQNRGVYFGRTAVGDDGNLYVMRAASPAIIYVVTPGGRVERTLVVQPPAKGAQPIALLAYGGRVAIEFSLPAATDVGDTRIRIVNAHSGHAIVDYEITGDLGEAVACYNVEQFTFLGSKDGWPSLIQAPTH
jgi:hypothetical protein